MSNGINKGGSKRRGGWPKGKPRKYPKNDFALTIKNQEPEIDFFAALQPQEPTPSSPPTLPEAPYINKDILVNSNNNLIGVNDIEVIDSFNSDNCINKKPKIEQLEPQEQKFLEFYIFGNQTLEEAMNSAGYGHLHPKYIYVKARKIILKYERLAGDARQVFRDIGFGELSIAKGIKALAQTGKSEVVKLRAHELAAKCTKMTQEQIQINQGIQIVITCSQEETPIPQPGQYRPATIYLEQQAKKTKPPETTD